MSLRVNNINTNSIQASNGLHIRNLLKVDNITNSAVNINFFDKDLELNLTGSNIQANKITLNGGPAGSQLPTGITLTENSDNSLSLMNNNNGREINIMNVLKKSALNINGLLGTNFFGWSVAMSSNGTRIAVGAPKDNSDTGLVRAYDLSGGAWVQIGQDITGESSGDKFGSSITMSDDGTRIAVGAPKHNSRTGLVRVYDFNGSVWAQVGQDINGMASQASELGTSIAISSNGGYIVAGAPMYEHNKGSVRVYKYINNTSSWSHVTDLYGESFFSFFGHSVTLSNTRIVVGSYFYNGGTISYAGRVYIYEYNSTGTGVTSHSIIDGTTSFSSFGKYVSISSDGSRLAVSSPGYDNLKGQVKVYDWYGSTWTQIGQDINGTIANDEFGHSIALSGDGSRIVVGCPNSDGQTQDAADNRGRLNVYDYNSTSDIWKKIGPDIDGFNSGDNLGQSVAISEDGIQIAGCAHKFTGYVHIFNYFFENISVFI